MNIKLTGIVVVVLVSLIVVAIFGKSYFFKGVDPNSFLQQVREEVEAARENYTLYGLYPGMSRYEVGNHVSAGTNYHVSVYPDMPMRIDYVTYKPVLDVKAHFDSANHYANKTREKMNDKEFFAEKIVAVRDYSNKKNFSASVLEQDIRKKFGEPDQRVEQTGMLRLIYKAKGPSELDLHNACFDYGQSAGVQTGLTYSTVSKMKSYEHYLNAETVEMVNQNCPNVLPMYKEFLIRNIGPALDFRIHPTRKRLVIQFLFPAEEYFTRQAVVKFIQGQDKYEIHNVNTIDTSSGSDARL